MFYAGTCVSDIAPCNLNTTVNITVKSHEHHGFPYSWHIDWLFNQRRVTTESNENISASHHCIVARGIHRRPVVSPHNGPVFMSWCHEIIFPHPFIQLGLQTDMSSYAREFCYTSVVISVNCAAGIWSRNSTGNDSVGKSGYNICITCSSAQGICQCCAIVLTLWGIRQNWFTVTWIIASESWTA